MMLNIFFTLFFGALNLLLCLVLNGLINITKRLRIVLLWVIILLAVIFNLYFEAYVIFTTLFTISAGLIAVHYALHFQALIAGKMGFWPGISRQDEPTEEPNFLIKAYYFVGRRLIYAIIYIHQLGIIWDYTGK